MVIPKEHVAQTLHKTLLMMRRTIIARTLPQQVQATNERLVTLDQWVTRWVMECWQRQLSTRETMAMVALDPMATPMKLKYFRARWNAFCRSIETNDSVSSPVKSRDHQPPKSVVQSTNASYEMIARTEPRVPPRIDWGRLLEQQYKVGVKRFAPAWVVLLATLDLPEWRDRLYRSSIARVSLTQNPATLDRSDATLQWDIQRSPWCGATLQAASAHRWLRNVCGFAARGTLTWHGPPADRNPLRAWRWVATMLAFNPMLLKPMGSWYAAPAMAWGASNITRSIPFVTSVDAATSLDSDSTAVVLLHRADGKQTLSDTIVIRGTRYRLRGMSTRKDVAWLCVRVVPAPMIRGGAGYFRRAVGTIGSVVGFPFRVATTITAEISNRIGLTGALTSLVTNYAASLANRKIGDYVDNAQLIADIAIKKLLEWRACNARNQSNEQDNGKKMYLNPYVLDMIKAEDICTLFAAVQKIMAKVSPATSVGATKPRSNVELVHTILEGILDQLNTPQRDGSDETPNKTLSAVANLLTVMTFVKEQMADFQPSNDVVSDNQTVQKSIAKFNNKVLEMKQTIHGMIQFLDTVNSTVLNNIDVYKSLLKKFQIIGLQNPTNATASVATNATAPTSEDATGEEEHTSWKDIIIDFNQLMCTLNEIFNDDDQMNVVEHIRKLNEKMHELEWKREERGSRNETHASSDMAEIRRVLGSKELNTHKIDRLKQILRGELLYEETKSQEVEEIEEKDSMRGLIDQPLQINIVRVLQSTDNDAVKVGKIKALITTRPFLEKIKKIALNITTADIEHLNNIVTLSQDLIHDVSQLSPSQDLIHDVPRSAVPMQGLLNMLRIVGKDIDIISTPEARNKIKDLINQVIRLSKPTNRRWIEEEDSFQSYSASGKYHLINNNTILSYQNVMLNNQLNQWAKRNINTIYAVPVDQVSSDSETRYEKNATEYKNQTSFYGNRIYNFRDAQALLTFVLAPDPMTHPKTMLSKLFHLLLEIEPKDLDQMNQWFRMFQQQFTKPDALQAWARGWEGRNILSSGLDKWANDLRQLYAYHQSPDDSETAGMVALAREYDVEANDINVRSMLPHIRQNIIDKILASERIVGQDPLTRALETFKTDSWAKTYRNAREFIGKIDAKPTDVDQDIRNINTIMEKMDNIRTLAKEMGQRAIEEVSKVNYRDLYLKMHTIIDMISKEIDTKSDSNEDNMLNVSAQAWKRLTTWYEECQKGDDNAPKVNEDKKDIKNDETMLDIDIFKANTKSVIDKSKVMLTQFVQLTKDTDMQLIVSLLKRLHRYKEEYKEEYNKYLPSNKGSQFNLVNTIVDARTILETIESDLLMEQGKLSTRERNIVNNLVETLKRLRVVQEAFSSKIPKQSKEHRKKSSKIPKQSKEDRKKKTETMTRHYINEIERWIQAIHDSSEQLVPDTSDTLFEELADNITAVFGSNTGSKSNKTDFIVSMGRHGRTIARMLNTILNVARPVVQHPLAVLVALGMAIPLLYSRLRGKRTGSEQWYRYAPKTITRGSQRYFEKTRLSAALKDSKKNDSLAWYLRE